MADTHAHFTYFSSLSISSFPTSSPSSLKDSCLFSFYHNFIFRLFFFPFHPSFFLFFFFFFAPFLFIICKFKCYILLPCVTFYFFIYFECKFKRPFPSFIKTKIFLKFSFLKIFSLGLKFQTLSFSNPIFSFLFCFFPLELWVASSCTFF